MKKVLIAGFCAFTLAATGQIKTPQPSPAATVTQTVGLTEVTVDYSRPSKKDRVIFGELVPYGEMWRTGANKNTIITTSEILVFGSDTLKAGSYSLFTKPMNGKDWEVYFYMDTENWGTPEKWDESMVAVKVMGKATAKKDVTESMSFSFDAVHADGATLSLSWDKIEVSIPFSVGTKHQVMKAIDNVMAGPSSNDYYRSAVYYLTQKKDLKTALGWMNKSLEMRGEEPFWMLRQKSLIQAELGDYKAAIATANKSLEAATKAENKNYMDSNKASIEEWTKKM